MSFTENLYLKRHLKQLHEENLKLKRTINEVYGQGAYPNPNDMRAVDRVDLKSSDLQSMFDGLGPGMSHDEVIRLMGGAGQVSDILPTLDGADAFRLGQAHASHPDHRDKIPARDIDAHPEYAAGARSVEPKLY